MIFCMTALAVAQAETSGAAASAELRIPNSFRFAGLGAFY
jgi:hypothetical protein